MRMGMEHGAFVEQRQVDRRSDAHRHGALVEQKGRAVSRELDRVFAELVVACSCWHSAVHFGRMADAKGAVIDDQHRATAWTSAVAVVASIGGLGSMAGAMRSTDAEQLRGAMAMHQLQVSRMSNTHVSAGSSCRLDKVRRS